MDKTKLSRLNPTGDDILIPTNSSIHGVTNHCMMKTRFPKIFFVDLVNSKKKVSHNQETVEHLKRRMVFIPGS